MKEKIRDLVKRIFEEEIKYQNNYLIKSRFWIRKRIIAGCYGGDEYSVPNIDEITNAIEEIKK